MFSYGLNKTSVIITKFSYVTWAMFVWMDLKRSTNCCFDFREKPFRATACNSNRRALNRFIREEMELEVISRGKMRGFSLIYFCFDRSGNSYQSILIWWRQGLKLSAWKTLLRGIHSRIVRYAVLFFLPQLVT